MDVLALLVQHHLLLPDVATRRDLDDPATLAQVAEAVGTLEVLDLLAAMTEADALATGPAAWTPWRADLIGTLVERTSEVLRGRPAPVSSGLTDAQRALAREGVVDVAVDAPQAEGTTITVVAPDKLGLLAAVAGVLSMHRLAVRSAVTETLGGAAVTIWTVSPEFGSLPDAGVLRTDVKRALDGQLDVAERLARREAAYAPRVGIAVPPPRVHVIAGASDRATVLEVRAHDRPGLLYRIGQALAGAGVSVVSAKVSTWGAEAVDVFYVVDPDTGDVLDDAKAALGAENRSRRARLTGSRRDAADRLTATAPHRP